MTNIIVDKCEGCVKIVNGACSVYACPKSIWEFGGCAFANVAKTVVKDTSKFKRTSKTKLFVESKYRRNKKGPVSRY